MKYNISLKEMVSPNGESIKYSEKIAQNTANAVNFTTRIFAWRQKNKQKVLLRKVAKYRFTTMFICCRIYMFIRPLQNYPS